MTDGINVLYSGRLISTNPFVLEDGTVFAGINVLYSGRLISTPVYPKGTIVNLRYQCPLQRTSHFYGEAIKKDGKLVSLYQCPLQRTSHFYA